jgi:hypothetical protein
MPKDAAAKVSVDELTRKLADLSIPEEELAKYFLEDEEKSTPVKPVLKLNPETVQIPPASDVEGRARSAALLNSANVLCKLRRQARYEAMVAAGFKGPLIAAEGDSWFQYPFILKDVIDHLFTTNAIFCRSEAGDTLQNMVARKEYLDALDRTGGRLLLLSGGGNDLVAGGELARHLRPFDPRLTPQQYPRASFDKILDDAISCIERIVRDVGRAFPRAAVITHGYDYAIPADGKWLGRPMKSIGIKDRGLQQAIAREMIDRLNTRLESLAGQSPRLTYVDCRGVVGPKRWHDELHPTDAGYADVAKKIVAEIKGRTAARGKAAPKAAAPSAPVRARNRARAATPPEAAVAKGYSLHIGLNFVDPAHYEGWDGELTACEFDAADMAALAAAVGYEAKTLLREAATRDAVLAAISAAAAKMKPGDIFLMSYSGHGGQVPDFSGDEAADQAGDVADETLCLFDGQLIDDELYAAWGAFPADSRVLVISDCCHSGSNVKEQMVQEILAEEPGPAFRPRLMPRAISARVARAHRGFYRKIAAKAAEAWADRPATREMALPVKASVRLVSACQDNQVALDGLTNGLFTGRLLEAWGEGAFSGDYAAFHRAIVDRMPATQTPNHFLTGNPSPAFDAQRPFDI